MRVCGLALVVAVLSAVALGGCSSQRWPWPGASLATAVPSTEEASTSSESPTGDGAHPEPTRAIVASPTGATEGATRPPESPTAVPSRTGVGSAEPTPSVAASPTAVATPFSEPSADDVILHPTPRSSLWKQRGLALTTGELEGVVFDGEADAVTLPNGAPAGRGLVTSRVLEAPHPFTSVVVSWNADTPPGTELNVQARVRVQGAWSTWYRLGVWALGRGQSVGGQADALAAVDVDTLSLRRPADAVQYRVELRGGPAVRPSLRLVAVSLADPRAPLPDPPALQPNWARDLPVPARSQLAEHPSIAGLICSPTSLSMVLAFWGVEKPTAEVCQLVYDRGERIYGNWPFNTAAASGLGMEA